MTGPRQRRMIGPKGPSAGRNSYQPRATLRSKRGAMDRTKLLSTLRLSLSAVLLVLGLLGPLLSLGAVRAQSAKGEALVIKVDGVINHVEEGFVARMVERAEDERAALLIIQLDTPGGLLSSTRGIVETLLEDRVPTVVFVSPKGAHAASAGTFITVAANFAVMAPGTNIGAATPISSTGQDLGETLANKATNDAAEWIQSIAEVRGRNQEELAKTVRDAKSFTATEALDKNIVDFIAEDLDDLLALLDGREVETSAGPVTLDTKNLRLNRAEKNPWEKFVEVIADPNISFILLTIGALGIVVELFNPGLIIPGVVGVIALILAFVALGNLPFNWAGVAFIVLAVLLVVLETQVSGFGAFGAGALVSFILGGLILFSQIGPVSPDIPNLTPDLSVSLWLLGGLAAFLALSLGALIWIIQQSRKRSKGDEVSPLVGRTGRVTMELAPRGVVRIDGETWTAESQDGTVVPVGESVTVAHVDGLTLTVSLQSSPDRVTDS